MLNTFENYTLNVHLGSPLFRFLNMPLVSCDCGMMNFSALLGCNLKTEHFGVTCSDHETLSVEFASHLLATCGTILFNRLTEYKFC